MGTNAAEKRQKLFEVNSAGLVALNMAKPDTFVCPLCLKIFTKDDLKPKNTPKGPELQLTLAHIIPGALGGRLCTLACKDCNNAIGKSLEAALKKHFVVEDAINGIGKLRARLAGDFGNVGVEVSLRGSGDPWQLEPVAKTSNPAHSASLEKMLVGTEANPRTGPPCELKFEHEYQPVVVAAALYHAAYLLMFHYFGYPFAFSPLGEQLREQIREPVKDILRPYFPLPSDAWVQANMSDSRKHAVVLIQEPYVGIHVMLRFQPNKGLSRIIGVALADLDGKTWPTGPVDRFRGSIVHIKDDGEDLPPWMPRARSKEHNYDNTRTGHGDALS
jgi:hypothetical protein